jgi:PKD repeat protein
MVVDFIFNTVGLKSNFINLSYEVPDEYTYSWDFGDGETSTELNPTHEYQKMGFYRVSMSIVDSNNRPVEKVTKTVLISDKVKTHLSNSIYVLINTYIPYSIFGKVPSSVKQQFIEKWQLYIQPLVNHEIPVEDFNNELYYEALENQLIMELAAYDYMILNIQNVINATSQTIIKDNSQSSGSSSDTSSASGGSIKKIVTGPTEVEYFNDTESEKDFISNITKATQPGGFIDILKQNLCMLAGRLDIYLPICENQTRVVVPRVVNRRKPRLLDGPDPLEVLR